MIQLDGSHGEGGGQLVRTAVALSALTGKPLHMCNVRAHRDKPGLAPQHLAAVQAVASLCDARCDGLMVRSRSFSFSPRCRPKGGSLRVDVGTAGSVTLVLQALLPVLVVADAPSRAVVSGGTDVRQAPSWDYFCQVLLPLLARMRVRAYATSVRRGYYPRGGGEVTLEVQPCAPAPLSFAAARGSWRISGEAHVANLPLAIAERMGDAAQKALARTATIRARRLASDEAAGTGGAVTLWATSDTGLLGACRVAQRGVRAELLGEAAGRELAADLTSGAMLDTHAADQILVYLALARGDSSFSVRELTSHAYTTLWLLSQFLPMHYSTQTGPGLARVTVKPEPLGGYGLP